MRTRRIDTISVIALAFAFFHSSEVFELGRLIHMCVVLITRTGIVY